MRRAHFSTNVTKPKPRFFCVTWSSGMLTSFTSPNGRNAACSTASFTFSSSPPAARRASGLRHQPARLGVPLTRAPPLRDGPSALGRAPRRRVARAAHERQTRRQKGRSAHRRTASFSGSQRCWPSRGDGGARLTSQPHSDDGLCVRLLYARSGRAPTGADRETRKRRPQAGTAAVSARSHARPEGVASRRELAWRRRRRHSPRPPGARSRARARAGRLRAPAVRFPRLLAPTTARRCEAPPTAIMGDDGRKGGGNEALARMRQYDYKAARPPPPAAPLARAV